MKQSGYTFTLAKRENYNDYHRIRSEKKNLFWTGYRIPPDYDRFFEWYKSRLADPNRDIFLIYDNGLCMGSLHIDFYYEYVAIGYSVMEAHEGKGIGKFLVEKAIKLALIEKEKRTKLSKIIAWINVNNVASRRVVEKNGFKKSTKSEIRLRFGREESYIQYEKLI